MPVTGPVADGADIVSLVGAVEDDVQCWPRSPVAFLFSLSAAHFRYIARPTAIALGRSERTDEVILLVAGPTVAKLFGEGVDRRRPRLSHAVALARDRAGDPRLRAAPRGARRLSLRQER